MDKKINLTAARVNAGLTQKQMAETLGVSITTYQGYEHGRSVMRMDTAQKFCDTVKIPQEKINFFTN